MIVTHLKLTNWRNFQQVDTPLRRRMFLIGPNAAGKSNLLDAFRFLHDIAKQGGGLQTAVAQRGGLAKLRCLAARRNPQVEVDVQLEDEATQDIWQYQIGIRQESSGNRQLFLTHERVWENGKNRLDRPDTKDEKDQLRLSQTHLEQINSNRSFRPIADFFKEVLYLHLVPQLLRHSDYFTGPSMPGDPFGKSFLDRVAKADKRTRKSRLAKIEKALQIAVPQLKGLTDIQDERGMLHLEATYEHWRARGAKQREDQFSDGTLRLIGLFWSLLETDSLLLLEEPELSLNSEIVRRLPGLMFEVQQKQKRKRQVIISTHSADLLHENGIAAEEVLFLKVEKEGTQIQLASDIPEVVAQIQAGLSIGDALMPKTNPQGINQLSLSL